ncbi:amiloride-sensitive sodium channel subunit beta-like [Amphibalanus amphitrite]|uniref:amiloride-sensitive sodium channel subunit beta-like n=1 Tax=Amphibalanus amphitrite TaxID=1232801 RepID=UPI001C91165F|nr:amiloride-sensitive sodium channel subunit beta-like [Amphibalanus amphitrite]
MPYPYTSHCISTWADSGLEPYGVDPTTGAVGPSQARYTLAECNRMCLQHHLVKNCGCHDPLYPLEFTVDGELQDVGPACDLSFGTVDSGCSTNVTEALALSRSEYCTCSSPCYETVYEPQPSVASWPQGEYLGTLLEKLDFLQHTNFTTAEIAEAWGSEFVKLNVYFRDLNIASITESATYTYSTFISSLGGALSLYLGIALILLVELAELLVFLAWDTARFMCGYYPLDGHSSSQVVPAEKRAVRVVFTAPENKSANKLHTSHRMMETPATQIE